MFYECQNSTWVWVIVSFSDDMRFGVALFFSILMPLFCTEKPNSTCYFYGFLIDGNNQPKWKENYTTCTLSKRFVVRF